MKKANLYETLGVTRNASDEEIKKAYKKAASKAHPDREGGSTEAFQQVQRAYSVLKDSRQRTIYDYMGNVTEEDLNQAVESSAFDLISTLLTRNPEAQLKAHNMITVAINEVVDQINGMKDQQKQMRASVEKLVRMTERLSRKNGLENRLQTRFEHLLYEERNKIKAMDIQIEMHQRVKKYLETYEWKADQKPQRRTDAHLFTDLGIHYE